MKEKEEEEFVELADLGIGKCRLSLAGNENLLLGSSKLKIATKYPKAATKFMESIGIQAEIIYLVMCRDFICKAIERINS